MSPRRWVVLTLALLLVVVGPTVLAGPGETLTVEDSVDIPDRTATYDGEEYAITAVKRAGPGDTIRVSVTVVDDDPYRVHVRNADDDLVESSNRLTENTTVEFNLTEYESGTYLVGLNQDGRYRAIQPLLVRGYAVSASVPDEAEAGGTLDVSGEVSYLRGNESEVVQVVVGNDTTAVRTNATRDGDTFKATVPLDEFDAGTYAAYAVVQGPDEAFGEPEILGVSDRSTVELTASGSGGTDGGTSGGTDDDTDGGTSGGTSGGTGTTATPTRTATPTETSTTPTSTPTETPTPMVATSISKPTATDDDVITPRTTTGTSPGATATATPTDESGVGQPLGLGPPLVAVALVALLAWRRGRAG